METQLELPLMARVDGGPDVVPAALVRRACSYREAVRYCWQLRRLKSLTASDMAREFGFNRQHFSDYICADDRATRRNLPPDGIPRFEQACGNSFITQWIAGRRFTLLEEMQAERLAA